MLLEHLLGGTTAYAFFACRRAVKPDSIIRAGVVIGRDIADREMKVVEVVPVILGKVAGDSSKPEQKPLFNTEKEKEVARATLEVIKQFERLPTSSGLKSTDTLKKAGGKSSIVVCSSAGRTRRRDGTGQRCGGGSKDR